MKNVHTVFNGKNVFSPVVINTGKWFNSDKMDHQICFPHLPLGASVSP